MIRPLGPSRFPPSYFRFAKMMLPFQLPRSLMSRRRILLRLVSNCALRSAYGAVEVVMGRCLRVKVGWPLAGASRVTALMLILVPPPGLRGRRRRVSKEFATGSSAPLFYHTLRQRRPSQIPLSLPVDSLLRCWLRGPAPPPPLRGQLCQPPRSRGPMLQLQQ